jgi:RNA polymerase sigma-70 factor (ECF subfamily)
LYKLVLPIAALNRPVYPDLRMEMNDSGLIERLKNRDEAAFEEVFKDNFKNLHSYAIAMLKDETIAEEMVQNVFFKLWERQEQITISGSIRAYLYRAVHNESLNHLKHMKIRRDHQLYVSHRGEERVDGGGKKVQLKELQEELQLALNELPEQCRTVFQLSRFEELRYREIADKLQISVKTVESHMGKALKLLRARLSEFLILIFLFIH